MSLGVLENRKPGHQASRCSQPWKIAPELFSVLHALFCLQQNQKQNMEGSSQWPGGDRKPRRKSRLRHLGNSDRGSNHAWWLWLHSSMKTEVTHQPHQGIVLSQQHQALEQPQPWWARQENRPQPEVEELRKHWLGLWRKGWTPTLLSGCWIEKGAWVSRF